MSEQKQRCWACGSEHLTYWTGTGYTKLVCGDCGEIVDDDPLGEFEYERYYEWENDESCATNKESQS
ncbi:MAG: hypothetical protein JXA33_10890 [Anaerolineae bacterium]|nr:hypothetical protein [Anaerolineae bacterium]